MMPPSGMPRPDFETYGVMTSWLESELDRNWLENPNPGRVTPIHRMNRYEYNNAINNLLGIDVDVMELPQATQQQTGALIILHQHCSLRPLTWRGICLLLDK